MTKLTSQKSAEGAQFVRYFGPLLDALRGSGGLELPTRSSNESPQISSWTLAVNPLVSFKVLFQCKRFSKSVSPSHVRDFRGEARREASRDGVPPIELIDGEKFIDMLEQLELGLRAVKTYEVDPESFREFEG